MNIFQMKTRPHGIERFGQFIDEDFICIGWPGIGNLEDASKDEIRYRLEKKYGYQGHKLGNALGQVNTFVNTMKAGDIVFIAKKDRAYIGKVGDYTYEQKFDNDQDGMCHRRQVEWLDESLIKDLEGGLQKLLTNRNTICQHHKPIEKSNLSEILEKKASISKEAADKLDSLFDEALEVLKEELKSEDPERRLKAATELIRLKDKK